MTKPKKTNTNQNWTKISETKISQTLLELRKTRDGKADQVRERNRIFRWNKKKIFLMKKEYNMSKKIVCFRLLVERLKRVNKHIQIQKKLYSPEP
jgi:hypothetical protein